MIKFHVVKKAKEAALYFVCKTLIADGNHTTGYISLIYSLLTAKCFDLWCISSLIDYSMYFKDIIPYYYCQFSSESA